MIKQDVQINGKRRCKIHFDSQMEAAEYLLTTPSKWEPRATSKQSGPYHGRKWDFGLGWRGVQALAKRGWSEGAKDLSDKLSVHLPNQDHVVAWRYDVAGELPDVGRYLAGDPAHMRRHGHPKGHRPIISIFINNWIRYDVTANQMANYGAAMVAMIDQLENMGRRVELTVGTVCQSTINSNTMMSATWKVKGAEDPIDMGAVAFAVAHPGASRRFGWSLWERTEAPADSGFGSGSLSATQVSEADLTDPFPGTLVLVGLRRDVHRCHNIEDALKFACDQINEAAGEPLVTLEA